MPMHDLQTSYGVMHREVESKVDKNSATCLQGINRTDQRHSERVGALVPCGCTSGSASEKGKGQSSSSIQTSPRCPPNKIFFWQMMG